MSSGMNIAMAGENLAGFVSGARAGFAGGLIYGAGNSWIEGSQLNLIWILSIKGHYRSPYERKIWYVDILF